MNKRQRKKYLKNKGMWFSVYELMDLDLSITEYVLPRLKAFKKHTIGHPAMMTEEEWNIILDKMINAFEWQSRFNCSLDEEPDDVREGMGLFIKWYRSLWF